MERTILIMVWVVCIVLIPITIPKNRTREAVLLFLSTQLITWILSLLYVEGKLLEYPIREFPAATGSNFTNNYLFFPFLSTLFSLYYPKQKSIYIEVLYQAGFILFVGAYLALIATYTGTLHYIHFNLFIHMLMNVLVFNVIRTYGAWFFQKKTHRGR
ncbi:CBO0543 family protein [Paenibacillus sp. yr247]|uniref:CBO0543 family protein n=1 Tax=Paenibacillus sp. yr247 TaxID=1761880 RepID=UPI00113FCAC3|nr:CBO0543 family protein [Paenibacillus sp. yr247]